MPSVPGLLVESAPTSAASAAVRRSSDATLPLQTPVVVAFHAMKWPELRRVRRDTLCYCLYAQVRGTWFASLAHVIGERQKESAQRIPPGGIRQRPDGKLLIVANWPNRLSRPQSPGGRRAKNSLAALNPAQIDVRLHSPHGGNSIIALQEYGAGPWNYLAACRTR